MRVQQPSDAALREEATGLLRELLRIDTSNPPGGETPAALLLKDYLESAGVECELVAKVPGRANLVARIRGSGQGPSLALLGHTDVVPADARDWKHPPFSGHLDDRSEEHTSELQSRENLVCRLLLEKKKKNNCHRHNLKKKNQQFDNLK